MSDDLDGIVRHLSQFMPDPPFAETIADLDMIACEAAAKQIAEDEELRLHSLYASIRGAVGSISRKARVKPSNVDWSAALSILLGQIIAGTPIEKRAATLSEAVAAILDISRKGTL